LVQRILKYDQEYVNKGTQYYEQRHRERQLQRLKKRTATLGLLLVETEMLGSGFWRDWGVRQGDRTASGYLAVVAPGDGPSGAAP
jgi:hypothetical protein